MIVDVLLLAHPELVEDEYGVVFGTGHWATSAFRVAETGAISKGWIAV